MKLKISTSLGLLAFALVMNIATNPAIAVIYAEDFTGQEGKGAIGTTSTTPPNIDTSEVDWSIDVTNTSLTATTDWFQVVNEVLEARDLDGEAIWISPEIDISSFPEVEFSLDASEFGNHEGPGNGFDYFDVSYKLDDVETLITNWNGLGDASHTLIGDLPDDNDWVSTTVSQTGLSGSTLQISVKMNNSADPEFMRLDNVRVSVAVPWEFNSTPGLLLVGSFWVINKLCKKRNKQNYRI